MARHPPRALALDRVQLRREKDCEGADAIREQLRAGGWDVVDSQQGSKLQPLTAPPSTLAPAIPRAVTLLTVVHGWKPDVERWLLSVHGEADSPFVLRWDELMALEQVEVICDIHCVTRWSKFDTRWRGVRVRTLIERAQPRLVERLESRLLGADRCQRRCKNQSSDRP